MPAEPDRKDKSPEHRRNERFITPPNENDDDMIISETSVTKEDYSDMCVKYTKFLLRERAKTKKLLDNAKCGIKTIAN
jgi:hypothetical protein